MITLEQVEKLKERANVSYADARDALEATDGDLLEAVIYLEREGKTRSPEMSSYNTQTGSVHGGAGRRGHDWRRDERYGYHNDEPYDSAPYHHGPTIRQQLHYFWRKFCELVRKTNNNHFEVCRDERRIISMPVTLLIISILCFFWVTLPLLVIALFFGCRYRFIGPDFGKDSINSVMDQAANAADTIRRTVIAEEPVQNDAENDERE